MAATSNPFVPLPLSPNALRKKSKPQPWPVLKQATNCSLVSAAKRISFGIFRHSVKLGWGYPLHCASGTLASVGPSEKDGVRRDYERELQELFEDVKSMIAAGKKDDAAELLRANCEAVKERVNAGFKGMEEAALMDVIALGYMALGDLKSLGSILDILNEVTDGLRDDEQLLDPILVHVASMYSGLGKFEKSVRMYQRAIGIMEHKYGKNSVFLVTPYLAIAKAHGSTGKAAKAIGFYRCAIAILEASRGVESEDLITPLFSLGNLLIQEGNAKEAETSFLRFLYIHKKLYGECDGRVGMAMCSLAHAKCATGNVDEAVNLYRQALQVIRDSENMSMDYYIMEKIRTDLAELLHAVGRGKEGRELLEECLIITERSNGKDHLSSVTHMINLATSHLRSKNYSEAEHLLRTSLQIMSREVKSGDPALTFPMLHLAVTLYHLRRDGEAEELALEVLGIRERAFGKDSLPVAEALDCLVSIQSRTGSGDGALLEKLKRVLRIKEREFGSESEEVLETLKKMAFYLDKLGMKVEKLAVQKRLAILRMKFNQRIPYS